MKFTLVITSNVENRYRGFLSSLMLEVAPGVYVSSCINAGVRDRIWNVLSGWYSFLGQGSLIMIWPDKAAPGQLQIHSLGPPIKHLVDVDHISLAYSPIS